jgi:hypothetical protein
MQISCRFGIEADDLFFFPSLPAGVGSAYLTVAARANIGRFITVFWGLFVVFFFIAWSSLFYPLTIYNPKIRKKGQKF